MTLVCPAHISNCGQLFRSVGAHQHSVANGGAIYMQQQSYVGSLVVR